MVHLGPHVDDTAAGPVHGAAGGAGAWEAYKKPLPTPRRTALGRGSRPAAASSPAERARHGAALVAPGPRRGADDASPPGVVARAPLASTPSQG
jgi:hypothetical protein